MPLDAALQVLGILFGLPLLIRTLAISAENLNRLIGALTRTPDLWRRWRKAWGFEKRSKRKPSKHGPRNV